MHRRRIALWAALPLLALPGCLIGPMGLNAQTDLLTVAESSGVTATSRHADVLAFAMELQRTRPLVRVETMAVSAEGRPVPLIVIGDPVPSAREHVEPQRDRGRLLRLLQGRLQHHLRQLAIRRRPLHILHQHDHWRRHLRRLHRHL